MDKIWRDIPGYEGLYLVSNNGDIVTIRPYKTSRLGNKKGENRYVERKLDKLPNGYLAVLLSKDKIKKKFLVHRLVCMVFNGIPENINQLTVNHIDGNKTNNKSENLQWMTQSENQIHAVKTGLQYIPSGENHYASKLTVDQINEIKSLKGKISQRAIAKQFNIIQQTVSDIQLGKRWKQIE